MAFKTLVLVGALPSLVMGEVANWQLANGNQRPASAAEKAKLCPDAAVSEDYKKYLGCPIGSAKSNTTQSASNNTVTTKTATNTLQLFKSQPSYHETPTSFGHRKQALQGLSKAKEEVAEKQRRKAVEVSDLQKKGTDVFGLLRLLEIAAFAALVMCPMMLTPVGRNALIAAGVVSADSELTKISIKASGGLAAQLTNFPLVEQAAAAMGFLHQEKKFDEEEGMEMNRTLINEGDGDSEDEAELTVDLGNLSRPMNNVVDKFDANDGPNAPINALPQEEVIINVGSAPTQQDILKYDQINIEYENGEFATDDFFDEDDDF